MANTIEPRSPKAVFTYGRFNPPTVGHKMVIDKVIEAAVGSDADAYVVVSHSQDPKKNPLFVTEKISLIRQMFPDSNILRILHTSKEEPYIGAIVQDLYEAGYEDITMLVGSDRVSDFQQALKGFPELEIVSAGERDPDSDISNISGVSATKIREAALTGNKNTVRAGINKSVLNKQINSLIGTIRERMAVNSAAGKKTAKAGKGIKKSGGSRKLKFSQTRKNKK
jgi:phosphopantetheine adenylyltransferase